MSEQADAASARVGSDVIVLDHVQKRFGDYVAVSDADFAIANGEFFSMLGPSGCGKTTTLKMIAGFEQPTSGRVLLEGEDVSRVPPYKRNVNTVFQQYALFPHMTIAENVAFGPKSKRVPKSKYVAQVAEMLDVVRLGEFAKRKPSQLSGGQQQRVALARALVNYPSALLLDEPLAALDLKLREAMQLELKRIQREVGITFVFVTHDQNEALTMSDRIAVMSQGVVEQIGTPEEIYNRPATLFVAGFIGSANLLPGHITASDGTDSVIDLDCGVRVRAAGDGSHQHGADVSVMVRPERLQVRDGTADDDGRSLHGRVSNVVFQGSQVRLDLTLADGTGVVAWIDPDDELPPLRPDAEITVGWAADAAYLLAGRPTSAGANDTDVDLIEAAL